MPRRQRGLRGGSRFRRLVHAGSPATGRCAGVRCAALL